MKSINLQSRRIKNIVCLSKQHLDSRNFERFGIRLFQQNGFKVEYWDVTPVLHPDVFNNYKPKNYFDFDGAKIFHDEWKLYNQLANLDNNSFVIDLVDFNFKFIKLYKALSKSKADYAVIMANAWPDIRDIDKLNRFYSILFRKIKSMFKLSPQELWNKKILPMLPLQTFGIKPAKFVLAGGENSIKKYHFPTSKTTEILWAHTYDYDIYLKELNNESTEQPIAVFLDQHLPFHSDWILNTGTTSGIDPKKYYGSLNKFFDIAEKELNVEVVIAVHPRSNYENMPDFFMGRKCIKGQTPKLVKECKLVLAHYSTSISFANLFYKPIIFITYPDLKVNSLIEVKAELHGKKAIFIDREFNINWKQELKVSKAHYKHYRQAFIKTEGSLNLPFWQILADRLKKI